MSSTPSSLQQRQRLHRRQNSTPVASEAMKVPALPPSQQRPFNVHRRGHSFDQRTPIRRQHAGMVSIANLGSIQQGHQILREAQQQRIARPGQQQQQQQQMEIPGSPQCGVLAPSLQSAPSSPYENMTTMNTILQNAGSMSIVHSPYFIPDVNMPMSNGLAGVGISVDENSLQYIHHMQAIDMGILPERRQSQPELRIQTDQRPFTPTNQIQTGKRGQGVANEKTANECSAAQFPLTPATTPFRNSTQMSYARSLQSSPIKAFSEGGIRSPHPVSMQRGRSLQGIVEHEETQQDPKLLTPELQRIQPAQFEVAEMPVPELVKAPSTSGSPALVSSAGHSPPVTPGEESLPFFDETGGEMPDFDGKSVPVLESSQAPPPGSTSPNRLALSPRRMSISDLNLDPGISASIEETNVTLDDIAQFIEGPDPSDNKWICKFEDCNKRFGRKENIKSHVQTHLGDRQFRCDHCKKCFVRGHDLKRHAKIHTGTKPYPCLCGNAFARHDALTRHRQRGMCIGAFDGVVKKVIKRGRPRKHRPEMEERLDKSSRTRKKVSEMGFQYASSETSCSMSSWGSPPTETLESLSIRGNSPFDDVALFGHPHSQFTTDTMSFPPDMFSFTPPASPGYSCGNKPSPSHRSITPVEVAEIPELPPSAMGMIANPMMLHTSQHSLPSLSHSSSSPAADIAAFDFSDDQLGHGQRLNIKMDHERNDFDNFLDYGGMEMAMDPSGTDGFFTI